ncbi:MAG: alkaline phosphatase D family protein [Allosphingosinicella sp.]|uniref:alkaline phosphatase D family protein n=1 Tax=Allosphingosinicella sp. TaxID=2823234 RepID=UPI003939F0F8
MTFAIDRRLLLKAATLGIGALAVPGAAQLLSARGFTHAVASGEPGAREAMLWTRYVPDAGDAARLVWQVSADPDFGRLTAEGETVAAGERDWCAKALAGGLAPGGWYYYRFLDAAGRPSPVGRTRTLPDGPVARFGLGVFSCSNLPFGHFNAYAHAAGRSDLDLMVHLGDYIYEYPVGTYPGAGQAVAGRDILPDHETVALADYRLRYAAYRSDPDLQRLHQLFPFVIMWDDHESANDAWKGGAENHQPETEGPWDARKAAAVRAWREWMPVSDDMFRSYRIGDLAVLHRPETRLTARDRPPQLGEILRGGGDPAAALAAFRDGAWRDPARTILGPEQERRLAEGFRAPARWHVLAQQVVVGSLAFSPRMRDWTPAHAPAEIRQQAAIVFAAAAAGLPFNFDAWDGYPAARERLLRSALDADASLVTLSGDSHNGWAFNLDLGGTPAGVDFGVQSVTSPGLEAYAARDPAEVAAALVAHNPQLAWADTSRRGYMSLTLTPERAVNEWHFLETVRQRRTALSGSHRAEVARGANRIA